MRILANRAVGILGGTLTNFPAHVEMGEGSTTCGFELYAKILQRFTKIDGTSAGSGV
jgi:hypothetical protein